MKTVMFLLNLCLCLMSIVCVLSLIIQAFLGKPDPVGAIVFCIITVYTALNTAALYEIDTF